MIARFDLGYPNIFELISALLLCAEHFPSNEVEHVARAPGPVDDWMDDKFFRALADIRQERCVKGFQADAATSDMTGM